MGGTEKEPIFEDMSDRAIENLNKLGIEGLIVIGGDWELKHRLSIL